MRVITDSAHTIVELKTEAFIIHIISLFNHGILFPSLCFRSSLYSGGLTDVKSYLTLTPRLRMDDCIM